MTKSKIILASLGVVAGLGTAALPLASYAADAQTVSGNVDLYVEVLPSIAMTIAGNNDGNSSYGSGNGAVDVFNPVTAASSSIDGHTTPATATSVASSSYASILPNAVLNGNDDNGFKSTIKVYTNNASGYTLNVKDADNTLALTKVSSTETIPAGTESEGSLSLTAGTAAWGYKIDTASADGTGYKAISATDAQVKTKATPTSNGEETKVYYGIATASDQATGVYTDTITYTATTNN